MIYQYSYFYKILINCLDHILQYSYYTMILEKKKIITLINAKKG